MPSRTDTAGHTKAFHYPVMGHFPFDDVVSVLQTDRGTTMIMSEGTEKLFVSFLILT